MKWLTVDSMVMRITILLDEEFMKKIRLHQAKLIQKTKKAVSFSKVLNDVLNEGFKNGRAKIGS